MVEIPKGLVQKQEELDLDLSVSSGVDCSVNKVSLLFENLGELCELSFDDREQFVQTLDCVEEELGR